MANFRRQGGSGGSGPLIDIIAPVTVPVGERLLLTDLVTANRLAAADSRVVVEVEPVGGAFGAVLEQESPTNGTNHTALGTPIQANAGERVRVRFEQGTPGPIAVTLIGKSQGPRQRDGALT